MENRVYLIKCQPVFNLLAVSCKNSSHISLIKTDHLSVHPAIVGFCKMKRCFVVGDRYQWLDPIFMAFVKKIIIKLKTFFVWCLLISVRENTTPCNGCTEYFEAHLRK